MPPGHAVHIQENGAPRTTSDHVVAFSETKCRALPGQPTQHRPRIHLWRGFVNRFAAECVSDAMHRSDETRLADVIVDRLPDFPDQHIESGVDDERVRPDARMQHTLVEHLRPMLNQEAEQVERLRGQVDVRITSSGSGQLPRVGIDRERGESHSHGCAEEIGKSFGIP